MLPPAPSLPLLLLAEAAAAASFFFPPAPRFLLWGVGKGLGWLMFGFLGGGGGRGMYLPPEAHRVQTHHNHHKHTNTHKQKKDSRGTGGGRSGRRAPCALPTKEPQDQGQVRVGVAGRDVPCVEDGVGGDSGVGGLRWRVGV